jgi:3-oxoacyl-[acyl-carrier protein] reductase
MDLPNSGRVAVVLASSRGIGKACAANLFSHGYEVVMCSRNLENVQRAAKEIGIPEAQALQVDVSKTEDIDRLFYTIDKLYGRLDVLVVNAGGPRPGTFMEMGVSDWETGFKLTFLSAVYSMRLAVERMRKQNYGRVVVLGSSSVRQPIDNLILSNAFRLGLVGVIKTMAKEIAPWGITVNMVAPGRINTDRIRELDHARAQALNLTVEEIKKQNEKLIPVGRYGEPEEVANLVSFLASPEAGYITSQVILIDGGMINPIP